MLGDGEGRPSSSGGNPIPNPNPKRAPKPKTAHQEGMDLIKKGTPRIIEAEGLQHLLAEGGMHLARVG